MGATRIAIVTTHPVQYYAPWFRHLAARPELDVRVFYLWDFGVARRTDPGFGHAVQWDVPLLGGYEHEFVPNASPDPGTHHFGGIDNPELPARLDAFGPDATLCVGYNFRSFLRLLRGPTRRPEALLLRGDSHRLVPPRGLKAWVKRQVLARLFRRFAGFLFVGQANRDYYRLHGVPADRLHFSPHAVDNHRFLQARPAAAADARAWKQELGIDPSAPVILFAGKFEPKKRPGDLLVAFRRAAVPGAALLFVGDGRLAAGLRRQAAGTPNMHFAPFQNQSAMPRTYATGDVLVLPSYGPGETWGLCVNEAMCLGRPAIVSSHVGCGPDLVTAGETGLVFPAGDIDGLAAALRTALADPVRLRAWGDAAARRVSRYSYAEATAGLLACLARLPARVCAP